MEKSERREYKSRNKIHTDTNFRKPAHHDMKKTVKLVERSKSRERIHKPTALKHTRQENSDIDKEIEIL